ncbi:MAG: hypothetical protein KTM48_02860 [Wolbachia endosymbiont of Pissodes strobi]|nr:hypothetical protein [Wolbachia endosymbiont of Pissodes strobi]
MQERRIDLLLDNVNNEGDCFHFILPNIKDRIFKDFDAGHRVVDNSKVKLTTRNGGWNKPIKNATLYNFTF